MTMNNRLWRPLALATLLCASAIAGAAPRPAYRLEGDCDGLPKIAVRTAPGYCAGLVAQGFQYPRGILPLPLGDIIVVDMLGFVENRGSLWRLKKTPAGGYQRERLFGRLDRPHGLAMARMEMSTSGRWAEFSASIHAGLRRLKPT